MATLEWHTFGQQPLMVPIRQKPNGPTSTSASYTTGLYVVEPQKKGTTYSLGEGLTLARN